MILLLVTLSPHVGVLLLSGVTSAWLVRRRLDRMAPAEALKTRE